MCEKCVKRTKNFGFKGKSFGQIKALAQSFKKNGIVGVYWPDQCPGVNTAIEAHLHRINRALTKKHYSRKDKSWKKVEK